MKKSNGKLSWKFFALETLTIIIGIAGMVAIGIFMKQAEDRLLSSAVTVLFSQAISFFFYRKSYYWQELDYNNDENILRFFICYLIGIIMAFGCSILPIGGWPYLFLFIMLSLFSNMNLGILFGCSCLLISIMLSNSGINAFLIYFVSGVFGIALFHKINEKFRLKEAFFLAMLCLLVCETANTILIENAKPDFEFFVIPVTNIIISSILMIGLLKYFYARVIYQYRDRYLEMCDADNQILTRFKSRNRSAYMHGVHTAYFCERIGKKLGLDSYALKCASNYYKIGSALPDLMKQENFPPKVNAILNEYMNRKNGVKLKESAVLITSDLVVSVIKMVQAKKSEEVDYDKVIDSVFKKILDEDTFCNCEITMNELEIMKNLFKEEKLYYDFLH